MVRVRHHLEERFLPKKERNQGNLSQLIVSNPKLSIFTEIKEEMVLKHGKAIKESSRKEKLVFTKSSKKLSQGKANTFNLGTSRQVFTSDFLKNHIIVIC